MHVSPINTIGHKSFNVSRISNKKNQNTLKILLLQVPTLQEVQHVNAITTTAWQRSHSNGALRLTS